MIKSFAGCLVALKIADMVDQSWWIISAIVLPLALLNMLAEYAERKKLR